MAKIRGVKPEYWTDDAIVELSIPARLMFIGLWNYACDNGHVEDKPKQIKMRLFPADQVDVPEMVDELVAQGRIRRENGYIVIPKFAEHQKPHKSWWQTCDMPSCVVPDGAKGTPSNRGATVAKGGKPTPRNSGATVAQPLLNSCATAEGDGEGEGEGDLVASQPKKRKSPATAIPEDWKPNTRHQQYAVERGVDLSHEAFRFRNHAHSVDRRLSNWNAGFTNWLSKAYPDKRQPRTANDARPEGW